MRVLRFGRFRSELLRNSRFHASFYQCQPDDGRITPNFAQPLFGEFSPWFGTAIGVAHRSGRRDKSTSAILVLGLTTGSGSKCLGDRTLTSSATRLASGTELSRVRLRASGGTCDGIIEGLTRS